MSAAHTTGPWNLVARYSDELSITDSNGFEHVSATRTAILLDYAEKLGIPHWADSPDARRDISEEEQAANARLIAAVPDLLAVAQDALSGLRREYVELAEKYAGTPFESDPAYQEVKARYVNARDAIAKATGRQT